MCPHQNCGIGYKATKISMSDKFLERGAEVKAKAVLQISPKVLILQEICAPICHLPSLSQSHAYNSHLYHFHFFTGPK